MTDQMLHDLLDHIRSHYYGKYRGTVIDNQDPTNRGRVRVQVNAVLGGLQLWAMPCVPYAGAKVGFCSLPPAGSGVWVEFEGGDPSFPIWSGCFWADDELPDDAAPSVKIWRTDSLALKLDDDGDTMTLKNTAESTITIASDIKAESGEASLTVGAAGVVSEQGAGKVEVTTASVSVNNGALQVA